MRVQVMTHEGPFNGTLFTYDAIGTIPQELRLASLLANFDAGSVTAHVYRLVESETVERVRQTFASYRYLRDVNTAISLVDQWIVPEEIEGELNERS